MEQINMHRRGGGARANKWTNATLGEIKGFTACLLMNIIRQSTIASCWLQDLHKIFPGFLIHTQGTDSS
jgi:hypothetical protein